MKASGKLPALLSLAAAALAIVSGCSQQPAAPANAATHVKFNMAWLPQGSQAGVIVAIDKGFYAAQQLEVEAVQGFGGTRTTNEVDQGMFEFGYGDPISVVLNRANGGTARLVGPINQRWPAGLCFLRERHKFVAPPDLAGYTVGGGQNSAVQALLPVWLERNGVPRTAVRILQLNPSVIVASLIEGKIDAAECWLGNSRPLFEREAAKAGLTLDWLEYGAHHLDAYGSGIITSDRLIQKNPALVAAFVQATYRGYEYMTQHPDEARDIMLKRYPTLDREVTAAQIRDLTPLLGSVAERTAIDPARMASSVEFITAGYGLAGRVLPQDIYSTQFLVAH